MSKEDFIKVLHKHDFTYEQFLNLKDEWDRLSWQDKYDLLKGDQKRGKHGRWTYDGKYWICTNCKKIAPCDRDGEYIFSPYCHHCGVRIDEVKE